MFSSLMTGLYVSKDFFTHAALLCQGCPHCRRFPTAASRRSLGRVSVPVWPIALSGRLPIIALVSRYLTNLLMGRGLISYRQHQGRLSFRYHAVAKSHPVLAHLSVSYPRLRGRLPTRYSPVRHCPDP